jgi:ABC-type phosphate transport system substrate-binding protein
MNILRTSLFLILLTMSQNVWAERIYVVVNEKNLQEVDPETVKQIYSDKVSFWKNGEEILVFELPVKSNAREKFAQNVLNKSAISSQRDWSNRFVNNTIKNDVKDKPQRLVARFVVLKKSSVEYVPESEIANLSGLKTMMTID